MSFTNNEEPYLGHHFDKEDNLLPNQFRVYVRYVNGYTLGYCEHYLYFACTREQCVYDPDYYCGCLNEFFNIP